MCIAGYNTVEHVKVPLRTGSNRSSVPLNLVDLVVDGTLSVSYLVIIIIAVTAIDEYGNI